MKRESVECALAASLLLVFIAATAFGQPQFNIELLPEPYGGGSVGCGVTPDSSGLRVVGSAFFEDEDNWRAATWGLFDPDQVEMELLPPVLEGASLARLEVGSWDPHLPGPIRVILGYSTEPSGAKRAVVWIDNGLGISPVLLPVLSGHTESDALGGWGITDPQGQTYVTGWGRDPMGSRHAMVWENTDGSDQWDVQGLPDLGPGTGSTCRGAFAPDLGNPTFVVCYGSVFDEDGRELPAMWEYSGSEWILVLVELPGDPYDQGGVVAPLIMGEGMYYCQPFVGYHERNNPNCESGKEIAQVLYAPYLPSDPPCEMDDYFIVKILVPYICSPTPFTIRRASQKEWQCPYYDNSYVGESRNAQMNEVATLWEVHPDTTVTAHDLNDLVLGDLQWPLRSARGIDEMGRIVGIAREPGPGHGIPHAFVAIPLSPSGVETVQPPGVPDRFQLRTSSSPFAEKVSIRYRVEEGAQVWVSVYDMLGREVAQLADGWHAAGRHERIWDGLGRRGEQLPSGIYWIRVQSGTVTESRGVVMSR